MDLTAVLAHARTAMAEHGLTEQGWSFSFDNAERRLGACNWERRRITISRLTAECATKKQIYQLILHEIAHALVGGEAGHSSIWADKARAIGYTGGRLMPNPYRRPGQAVYAILNPSDHAIFTVGQTLELHGGELGYIVSVGRTRYTVYNSDALTTIPFAIAKLSAVDAPVPAALHIRYPLGQELYLDAGVNGHIIKIGRAAYKVQAAAGVWTVPFVLASPADENTPAKVPHPNAVPIFR
jgi:hypothetical protein